MSKMNEKNNTRLGYSSNVNSSGHSNIAIGTKSGWTSIGGVIGLSGHSGHTGVAGFSIMDSVEESLKKWNNRFSLIESSCDSTLLPIVKIKDNQTLKEYIFEAKSMIGFTEDFKSFINNIIIVDRDDKIDTLMSK